MKRTSNCLQKQTNIINRYQYTKLSNGTDCLIIDDDKVCKFISQGETDDRIKIQLCAEKNSGCKFRANSQHSIITKEVNLHNHLANVDLVEKVKLSNNLKIKLNDGNYRVKLLYN